jgi:predicted transcriptional regulator
MELNLPSMSQSMQSYLDMFHIHQLRAYNVSRTTKCTSIIMKYFYCIDQEVVGSIPAGVNGFFIDIKSFQSHYGPGVDSASNRNEYREYFQGVKSGRCVRLTTYHHPVPLSRNLGTLTSWKPLGLSRPVMGLLYLYFYCIVATNMFRPLMWPSTGWFLWE